MLLNFVLWNRISLLNHSNYSMFNELTLQVGYGKAKTFNLLQDKKIFKESWKKYPGQLCVKCFYCVLFWDWNLNKCDFLNIHLLPNCLIKFYRFWQFLKILPKKCYTYWKIFVIIFEMHDYKTDLYSCVHLQIIYMRGSFINYLIFFFLLSCLYI